MGLIFSSSQFGSCGGFYEQDKRRWTAPNNWYGIAPNSAHMLPQPFCRRMMTIMIEPIMIFLKMTQI